ncbi:MULTISPECIES: MBL fold metallo-hydrolase [unclassified Sphingomonas]|uniref:MBL fold metallo-hydrolase n=1 Tax=unclassified Sphingomonas TaxID=196159 RepID=UPI0006F41660|nr:MULTISPECIES: MBL fold metallo-hydrolase [unclassified Sphingomonas]KQX23380.1 MBL fold metallo-hydrolase [Sphingomonas sp. Root1294]KQY68231.1 MBL fold metallo-hydrolase [Sphingomonas sp. Root50]KRB91128.1 MBL fold metallo-hydrolase [Sphingomonas sp. Root720]
MTAFTKGLHDLGNGHFAYLQPSGTWGYSNAGLIIDGDQSLLVDTLFDERLTAEMLDAIKASTRLGAGDITQLVNTHANGDHTFGNRLVANARVIATEAGAHEMEHEAPPEMLAAIMAQAPQMGALGEYLQLIFGPFDFAGVKLRLPDETFTGDKTIMVGDKQVDLIQVGPAHTGGDLLVHVPADRILYTGDILFVEGTPIMWAGPVRNWIAACDRMLAMDVEAIVPGHGPITDKAGVRAMRTYLAYVETETRKRHAAGMDAWEAAQDIALAEFGAWEDPERIAVTVDTIYREIDGDTSSRDIIGLFDKMSKLHSHYGQQGLCASGHKH